MRINKGDLAIREGRLRKAQQFAAAAEDIIDLAEEADDVADAYVTLCVHAGIAAADAICIRRLGLYAQGENHAEAVGLLEKASPGTGKHLSALLGMKTRAGYGHEPVSAQNRVRAGRAMSALLELAR